MTSYNLTFIIMAINEIGIACEGVMTSVVISALLHCMPTRGWCLMRWKKTKNWNIKNEKAGVEVML